MCMGPLSWMQADSLGGGTLVAVADMLIEGVKTGKIANGRSGLSNPSSPSSPPIYSPSPSLQSSSILPSSPPFPVLLLSLFSPLSVLPVIASLPCRSIELFPTILSIVSHQPSISLERSW